MTDNIISLDDHRPHRTTYVACLQCGKDWIAVAPADTLHFQCPYCLILSGLGVEPLSAEFVNTFMRPAKRKAERDKRAKVLLKALTLIAEGAFK
jgi:hypothetical protein